MRAWLRDGELSVAVPPEGLWIGRAPTCDLLVDDHRASQLHALVTWRGERLVLVGLGRNPTRLNGRPVQGRAGIGPDDVVELPGGRWTIHVDDASRRAPWVAVLPSGRRIGLGVRELVLGGTPDDDLQVLGWAPSILRVHRPPSGTFVLEALATVIVDGHPWETGTLDEVQPGTTVEANDVAVLLLALATEAAATTLLSADAALPIRVVFGFTPTGGELTLAFSGGVIRSVELPELRARLVAKLLLAPGEEVEDADLLRAVWPGNDDRTRLDLNQLVHRTRKDLLAAGVDPTPVLLRPRRGGAARFALASGARVDMGR